MLRRVFGARLPCALGCLERRRVGNVGADAHTQRKREGERERQAWPNLACLMKNGQESAYLARPSLHSTAAPPHFLLLLAPTLLLPPFNTLHVLRLSLLDSQTLISVASPQRTFLAQIQTSLHCIEPDTISHT